jgi:hypothetical protein
MIGYLLFCLHADNQSQVRVLEPLHRPKRRHYFQQAVITLFIKARRKENERGIKRARDTFDIKQKYQSIEPFRFFENQRIVNIAHPL